MKRTVYRVWGLATGVGNTKAAAPGAFTWHEYRTVPRAETLKKDWRNVVKIETDTIEVKGDR